jgi:uncharacterized protein (TIGR02594 family)
VLNKKHIKAPTTHHPGGGRPKEHLAYLNKAEMEMLRVLTDGVVEPGPKGIPSFAVSTGKTTTQSSNLSNSGMMGGRPSTSATGPGGMFGGTTTTSKTTTSGGGGGGQTAKSSTTQAAKSPSAAPKASASKPAAKAPAAPVSRGPAASMAAAKASAAKAPAASVSKPKQASPPRNFASSTSNAKPAVAPPAKPSGGFSQSQFGSAASNKTDKPAVAAAVARPSQNMQRPAGFGAGMGGGIGGGISAPISFSNAADPANRTAFGAGAPAKPPAAPSAPVSMSNPGQTPFGSFSKKTSWQTKPAASVMGSPASVKAMDPARLGLPKPAAEAMKKAVDPAKPPAQAMAHLDVAAKAIGLNERDKRAALQSYLKDGGINLNPAVTAWCAAFVNATLKQSGLPGTGSLMARSFLSYGEPTTEPKVGDIAVFKRGEAPYGHVGFFLGLTPDGKYVKVLGGNQKNAVNVSNYPVSRLLGYRSVPGQQPAAPTTGGFQTASDTPRAPAAAAPRPQARPWGPPPVPQARPDNLAPSRTVSRNPYDTNRTEGVPRARPEGVAVAPRPTPRPDRTVAGMSFTPNLPGPMMQSPVMGDPRTGMPPGSYPAQRAQSQVAGDPRVGMAPGSYPAARPASVMATDPRVSMPPGAYPAARMQSPVVTDPRVGMAPGAYPAAPPPGIAPQMARPDVPGSYPAAPPPVVKDQSRVPQERQNPFAEHASAGLPPGYAERYGLNQPAAAMAPAAPSSGLGGPIGGLVRGGQLLGNMAAGNVQIPGNAIKAALSNPNIGRYAKARAAGLGTIADGAASKVIGPAVRKAFADALGGVQNFIKNPPSRAEKAAEQPRGEDGRFTAETEKPARDGKREASGTKKTKSGDGSRYNGTSTSNSNQRRILPAIAAPSRRVSSAPRASDPAPPPVADWSYYDTVLTPEEVRRRLLGENWE